MVSASALGAGATSVQYSVAAAPNRGTNMTTRVGQSTGGRRIVVWFPSNIIDMYSGEVQAARSDSAE